jgi:hypothetical protein
MDAQSCSSIGLLTVCSGLKLNWTLMVTFLPVRFLGTRHEYEQVPPQPYSRLPKSARFPPAWVMSKVGLGGRELKRGPERKVE